MLCQNCKKNEATVNFVQTINGVSCAVHLCAKCANIMFGDFESQMQNAFSGGLFGEGLREEKVCPNCGMYFSEYQKTGLLGCPSCYDVFNEELLPYIARIQGKTEHVGKTVGGNTAEHDRSIRQRYLQMAMEEALGRGDYVTAGKINQQLTALKKRSPGNGGEGR